MSFDLEIWAKTIGWTTAGVSPPEISKERVEYFEAWLREKKGPQMSYLERRKHERMDPKKYFPRLQSILCFGLEYFPGWAQGKYKISNYAWGEDYHQVLRQKLEETVEALQKVLGDFEYKVMVDTAPALEKVIAAQAGLGWQGKNTLLLHRHAGSQFFLGEIFTDLPLSRFQADLPVRDHCGTCQRCIEACPTNALSPYELDAGKCISYWTLEHKGPFTNETPPWKEWIAGCDICQEVCPWNQKLIPTSTALEPQNVEMLIDLGRLDELVAGRAISYLPPESWKRNLEHVRKIR